MLGTKSLLYALDFSVFHGLHIFYLCSPEHFELNALYSLKAGRQGWGGNDISGLRTCHMTGKTWCYTTFGLFGAQA